MRSGVFFVTEIDLGQQINGNHRRVDIESLYSHHDYHTSLWTSALWKSHENVIKNPGKHFSGPWIQIFHFHGLFFRPWSFYKKLIMVFMAHENCHEIFGTRVHEPWNFGVLWIPWAMKITLRDFSGREKWEMIISISWVMNIPLNMCHVGPWNHIHWFHGPWKF